MVLRLVFASRWAFAIATGNCSAVCLIWGILTGEIDSMRQILRCGMANFCIPGRWAGQYPGAVGELVDGGVVGPRAAEEAVDVQSIPIPCRSTWVPLKATMSSASGKPTPSESGKGSGSVPSCKWDAFLTLDAQRRKLL